MAFSTKYSIVQQTHSTREESHHEQRQADRGGVNKPQDGGAGAGRACRRSVDVGREMSPWLWCSPVKSYIDGRKLAEEGGLARSRTSLSPDNWNRKRGRKGSFTRRKTGKLIGIVTRQPHSSSERPPIVRASNTHTRLKSERSGEKDREAGTSLGQHKFELSTKEHISISFWVF